MTDYFRLLEIERRPWLDTQALKEKFQCLSAATHPDRFHQSPPQQRELAHQRSAELNMAYQCLREPKDRLRHLLELEQGAKPEEIQEIPQQTMETSLEVARLCMLADKTLNERRQRAGSPLLQVELFERAQESIEQLRASQTQLVRQQEILLEELTTLNHAWAAPAAPQELPLNRLEEIYRLLSYLHRWNRQLGDRIVELSI